MKCMHICVQKGCEILSAKAQTKTKSAAKTKKTLVVVESPAKAKTIEKYLGRKFMVRASMGHLRDLPKSQFGIDVEHDFAPKYINIRGKGDIIKALKKDAKHADKIYLASERRSRGIWRIFWMSTRRATAASYFTRLRNRPSKRR